MRERRGSRKAQQRFRFRLDLFDGLAAGEFLAVEQQREKARAPQQDFGEKLAGRKERYQDFQRARVLFQQGEQARAVVLGKAFQVDE